MEKSHAMRIRKLFTGLALTLIATSMFAIAPLASAISFDVAVGDPDASQGDITAAECAGLEDSLAASMGCNSEDEIIDFTTYRGELDAPDESGYDTALTKTKSAREMVQLIVNFALSFLGLVSTVIIIYGGVMYVLSRGDEEMATKGKKAISYAVVGIVIILASFAIVNTLIGAAGGGNAGSGDGITGDTISQAGAGFDVEQVLDELTSISEDYVYAYDTLIFVNQEVEYLKSIEMPLIVDVVETDVSIGGISEWITHLGTDQDLSDQYQLIDENDVDEYISDLRQGLQKIQREVDSLSDTYEKVQELYNYLRSGGSQANTTLNEIAELLIPMANAYEGTDGCSSRSYSHNPVSLSEGFGINSTQTKVSEIDDNICPALDDIQAAAESDYVEAVDELIKRTDDLAALFDTGGQEGSTLNLIRKRFELIDTQLETAKDRITNQTKRDVIGAINDAYVLVQNVKFVNAIINTSGTRGNAPYIVRFDALGSTDPSGRTIDDTKIQWDLTGNGQFNDATGASVSWEYSKAGTYQVAVRIFSTQDDIAAGIGRITIIVEPRSSAIVVSAEAGGETTQIADFREFPYIDKDSYKVTLNEAQSGITFDASASEGANKENIEQWEWNFGDGATISGGSEVSSVTHAYGEAGQYKVELTVTDAVRIQDRHVFVVYVDSPAARIEATPSTGKIGTKFKLSAGGSTTDAGTIVSYQWSVTPVGSDSFSSQTGSNVEVEFDSPGVYTVTLLVADSSGKTDDASLDILVESQTPDAKFTYSVPNATEPGTYHFDASDSYDPDPNDEIIYNWDFGGDEGADFEILDDNNFGEDMTVRFLRTGKYEVSLTVCDQHQEELQKCEDAVAEINVSSVLDVELTIQAGVTRRLDESGEESVNFEAYSRSANAFEIDYGDGESEYTDLITSGFANFTHAYTRAGVFNVTLTVYDEGEGRNSITRRVYIASGENPIAVISVAADGEDIGFGDELSGNVQTRFTFDASDSINTDGTTNNLSYTWNFGDGTTASQKSTTKTFEELTNYTVTLTVKDKDDPSLSDQSTVYIRIQGIDPEIKGITITPASATLETPLKVNVSVNASDKDGRINFVKGWYYDVNDSATALGTVISESTNFSLTINTKGEQDEQVTYGFAAEVTDNDNRTVNSFEELQESEIPKLTVTNGPNDTPVANFSVDRTSFLVGEEVVFSSTSYDPDGEIVEYVWDVEGDGFFNNEPQETPSFTYIYHDVHTSGVKVKLKVTDNAGATATSKELTLYVDTLASPPDAAFLADVNGLNVTFHDNSTFDTANQADFKGISWDFDTSVDSNGNGVTDDDKDSLDRNPSHTYDELGTYRVSMTVTDTFGKSDSVTREVLVANAADPVAAFTFSQTDDFSIAFQNNSTTDEDAGALVRSFEWDFDTNYDSDGDGNNANDVDSIIKNPDFNYDDFGTYSVKLTVTDDFGKKDSVTNNVEVSSPIQPVTALLATVPQTNANKQIIMSGTSGDITIFYNAEGGSGNFTYRIDKNIFFDTSGDGIKDNDIDYSSRTSGSWRTNFDKSWGQIVIKLTVIDNTTGDSSFSTAQVIFQGSLAGANLFNATPSEMLFLIISALLVAIVGVSLVFSFKPVK